MNIKVSYICIGVLLITVLLLSIFIIISKKIPESEHIYFDGNLQLWGIEDAVPDEETAKKIADIIIGVQYERKNSYEFNGQEYDVTIHFKERENEWELRYSPIPSEGYMWLGGDIMINIRKDCGMITDMGFIP